MADRVVSQELTEKIVQFQEVTGTEDMEEAWSQLERHRWDLVAAVQDHLAIKDSASINARTTTAATTDAAAIPPQNNTSSSSRENDNTGRGDTPPPPPPAAPEGVAGPSSPPLPPPPPQDTPRQVITAGRWEPRGGGGVWRGGGLLPSLSGWGLLGWGYYLMTLPLRLTLASLSSFVLFLYRIVYPYPRRLTDPLEDVLRFIREYEADYGSQHPAFFQGSYSQALSHAKTELKFLLVYLHCADHQDTPFFCRSILSDTALVEYINTSMVFWGCSVTSAEGYRVSQAMRRTHTPSWRWWCCGTGG
ncbi:FAS-associated factor 2-like [Portunus trituberculatus]|uniref:FAS-associated factor 2-like n=1 Tax=Portunus trituberculatus TaxID=210409 RepID=UPI001E1D10F5|nr:FAS-associated factor 2-like [Portunus trituberculatus]